MAKRTIADDIRDEIDAAAENIAVDDGEQYVEFMIPVQGGDPNAMKPVFIGVNGDTIRLQPGVTRRIKKKFVRALENANDQRLAAWKYMWEAQNGRGPLANL